MNKKITQLPDATALTGQEYIPVVQGGETRRVKLAENIARISDLEGYNSTLALLQKLMYGYRMTPEQMDEWFNSMSDRYRNFYSLANTVHSFLEGAEIGATTIDKWRELETFLADYNTGDSLAVLLENMKSSLQTKIDGKASGNELIAEVNRAKDIESQKADKTALSNEVTARRQADKDLQTAINDKVDKIQGKGLSSNDFTTEEQRKLYNLATVATSGSYSDLNDIPISEITPESADRLSTSSSSKVYIFVDGLKRGLLIIECFGPSSARQTLYIDGIVKQREAAGMNSWEEWKDVSGGSQKKTLYIDSSTPKNADGKYEVDLSAIDGLVVDLEVEHMSEFRWIITALPLSDKSFTKEINCLMSTPGMIGNGNSAVINGVTYNLDINIYTGISYTSNSSPNVNALYDDIHSNRGVITRNKRFKLFMSFEARELKYTITFIPIS